VVGVLPVLGSTVVWGADTLTVKDVEPLAMAGIATAARIRGEPLMSFASDLARFAKKTEQAATAVFVATAVELRESIKFGSAADGRARDAGGAE
jgi:hypothetical protein